MKVNFSILAQSAAADIRTNTLSIISVVEGFKTIEFPAKLRNLVFILLLKRQENDPDIGKIKFKTSGLESDIEKEIEFNFGIRETSTPEQIKEKSTFKIIIPLPIMVINKQKDVKFSTIYNGKKIGEYELSIWG